MRAGCRPATAAGMGMLSEQKAFVPVPCLLLKPETELGSVVPHCGLQLARFPAALHSLLQPPLGALDVAPVEAVGPFGPAAQAGQSCRRQSSSQLENRSQLQPRRRSRWL